MLIDTGATVTLVSIKLFESITSPVMTEMKRKILTAGGLKLNVLGKTIGIIHLFSRLMTLLFHKWLYVRLNHKDACI
jgi:hypothetical protein